MEMKNWIKLITILSLWGLAQIVAIAQFRIVGYFPTWQGNVSSIQFDKLSHINYSFIWPTATGEFNSLGSTAINKMNQLVTAAHAANVKVCIAIGGWNDGDDSNFEVFAASQAYRTAFTVNVLEFIKTYNLDGVDIDWEYPNPGTSANNFAALMKELHDTLSPKGYLLTAAVVGEGLTGGGVKEEVFEYVDWLNIMAYDNSAELNHSTYSFALKCMTYWETRGLPKEKRVLGVPFYARSPSYRSYSAIVAANLDEAPYVDFFNNFHYNGIFTIEDKTYLSVDEGGGIMIWELSQDRNDNYSLLSAIKSVVDSYDLVLSGPSNMAIENSISIFPNPASLEQKVNIVGLDSITDFDLEICSIDGRKIEGDPLAWLSSIKDAGFYVIHLRSKESSKSFALIVR